MNTRLEWRVNGPARLDLEHHDVFAAVWRAANGLWSYRVSYGNGSVITGDARWTRKQAQQQVARVALQWLACPDCPGTLDPRGICDRGHTKVGA